MSSFGKQLKEERQQRGISLEEISQSTKISTRFLQALEDDHFNQLPGGIFNKGFIRAYARHLGLDEEELVAGYLAFINPLPAEKKPDSNLPPVIEARPAPPADETGTLPWGVFAVVLLVVALIFATWGFYSREKRERTSRPAPASARPTEAAAPLPAAPVPAQAASVVPASTGRVLAPALPAATVPPSSGALTLLLRVNEDSWLSITTDGKEIARGMFTGPTQRTFRADKQIVVKAGNVGALDFEFNGKKLPPQGDYDEVKTLTFDAQGLHPLPPKVEPPVPQP